MSAVQAQVAFAVMAKRTPTTSDKEPVNMRLTGRLLDRARDFIQRQPVKPSLTAVVETALAEWLDRHHPEEKKR